MSKQTLLKRHLDDLRASGLSDETIRIAAVYSERDPERIARLLNWEFPAKNLGPCLVFPFPDTAYSRVKPDTPRTGDDGKPVKYESPRQQQNRVYVTTGAGLAHKDTAAPVFFAEGEKKALALDQHGYPAFGLVGVCGWSKPKEAGDEERVLHPDFDAFVWVDQAEKKGRRVYIVFDSDAAYKDQPRWEEWALSQALTRCGADPRIIRLPQRLGGPKVGADDFLLANGPTAFDRLIQSAARPTLPPVGFTNEVKRPNPDKPNELITVARAADDIAVELVGRSEGWPRNVGGVLVVPDGDGRVRAVGKHTQLFAYIRSLYDTGGVSRVKWPKGEGEGSHVTRAEFLDYLSAHCERFDRADSLPHVPPIPGVLYTRPTPTPDGKFEALGKFLSFFSPATEVDESLLMACLLTPLWGGPPGKRPAFLFEADEKDEAAGRGVGKTTIAQKIARLYGGAFDIDGNQSAERLRNRLLTPDARSYRVLLMDNVKTFRLSSADLESLVTNPSINGHRLYHGQAAVPNYYTLFITLNGASLSRDFAQRVIPLRFTRAKYYAGWEIELDAFIDANRDAVVADLVAAIQRPPAKLARFSRWGIWEAEILGRVEKPGACQLEIERRTAGMDADREDADRFREVFAHVVERERFGVARRDRYLLSSSAVTMLVTLSTNNRTTTAGAATAHLKAIGVEELRKSDRKGRRLWLWTGKDYAAHPDDPTPYVIDYDPERTSKVAFGDSSSPWSRKPFGDEAAEVESVIPA